MEIIIKSFDLTRIIEAPIINKNPNQTINMIGKIKSRKLWLTL